MSDCQQFKSSTIRQSRTQLSADIEKLTVDGKQLPVKLKVDESVFVPLAKWHRLQKNEWPIHADSR